LNYGAFAASQDYKRSCILVVVPEYIHNDTVFYSEVIWSIEAEAQAQGYILIRESVTKSMEEYLTLPSFQQEIPIAGLLVVGIFKSAYIECLYRMGYPMLSVDIAYHNVPMSCVGTKNLNGGFIATKHLIDNGHRQIGFAGPVFTALSVYERWCGYKLAMQNAGLDINEDYQVLGEVNSFKLLNTVEDMTPYIKHLHPGPTAWFCAGDRTAIAMINIMAINGISVPDQVSVIGFDDIAMAAMVIPPLTTVRIDRKLMGKLAVEQMCRIVKTKQDNAFMTSITAELIVRNSVRAIEK